MELVKAECNQVPSFQDTQEFFQYPPLAVISKAYFNVLARADDVSCLLYPWLHCSSY